MPPFGTVRNAKGYLIPTLSGAWKLPTGGWTAGRLDEAAPVENALRLGYYDAAQRILELHSEDKRGYNRIAKLLTREGWAFRDWWDNPRLITSDDVRRVVSNWREYAGIVTEKARNRHAYENEKIPSCMIQVAWFSTLTCCEKSHVSTISGASLFDLRGKLRGISLRLTSHCILRSVRIHRLQGG